MHLRCFAGSQIPHRRHRVTGHISGDSCLDLFSTKCQWGGGRIIEGGRLFQITCSRGALIRENTVCISFSSGKSNIEFVILCITLTQILGDHLADKLISIMLIFTYFQGIVFSHKHQNNLFSSVSTFFLGGRRFSIWFSFGILRFTMLVSFPSVLGVVPSPVVTKQEHHPQVLGGAIELGHSGKSYTIYQALAAASSEKLGRAENGEKLGRAENDEGEGGEKPFPFFPAPSPSTVVSRSPQFPTRPTIRPWISEDVVAVIHQSKLRFELCSPDSRAAIGHPTAPSQGFCSAPRQGEPSGIWNQASNCSQRTRQSPSVYWKSAKWRQQCRRGGCILQWV